MANSVKYVIAVVALAMMTAGAVAADRSVRWLGVDFPRDSPVGLVSFSLGELKTAVRGTSLALNLHTSVTLRNSSNKVVRGLTLSVEAQDLTPSGKASVTVPSLNVAPGEIFPVRLDLELLRPYDTVKNNGPLIQVTLDGVLFQDLSFFGPNKLNSKRNLTVYELEARRDRLYFDRLLETGNLAQLKEEMNFGLPEVQVPQLGMELLRNPHSLSHGEHPVSVSFVSFPDAPVQMIRGAAKVYQNEVRAPQVDFRNQTNHTVKSIEMGWILRDDRGRDFIAGSVPAEVKIGPVQQASMTDKSVLRFSHPSGRPMLIDGVTTFINNVEFTDGRVWISSRTDISRSDLDATLKHAIATSPEQQRLSEIYRKRGMSGLQNELKKLN